MKPFDFLAGKTINLVCDCSKRESRFDLTPRRTGITIQQTALWLVFRPSDRWVEEMWFLFGNTPIFK